jgi:cell division cycle protein 20 (cofactor of APC complex)
MSSSTQTSSTQINNNNSDHHPISKQTSLGCIQVDVKHTTTTDWKPLETMQAHGRLRPSGQKTQVDRFIPNPHAINAATSQFQMAHQDQQRQLRDDTSSTETKLEDDIKSVYNAQVARALGIEPGQRVLAFGVEPPASKSGDLRSIYDQPLRTKTPRHLPQTRRRRLPTTAERVLDAPGIIDDFYLNLLDWSSQDMIALALDHTVYLWNNATGDVTELFKSKREHDYITSVKFAGDGDFLAIGMLEGTIHIMDTTTGRHLRRMRGRQTRVNTLDWHHHLIASGCQDGNIWLHDVRVAQHKTAEMTAHTGDVCGVRWREDGLVLASGGNDNLVQFWDIRTQPRLRYTKAQHTAAVKALAWCPWQSNVLATGGGSNDRTMHFWNSNNGALLSSLHTGAQITGLVWSPFDREILSTHGFPTNHISIWTYPTLSKLVDITAHETRVLFSALSPDGQMLATAAGDESLKIWRVFDSAGKLRHKKGRQDGQFENSRGTRIR